MHIVGRIAAKSTSLRESTCKSGTKLQCTPAMAAHLMAKLALEMRAVENYPVAPMHSETPLMPTMAASMQRNGPLAISVTGSSGAGLSRRTCSGMRLTLHDGAPQRALLSAGTDVTSTLIL